MMTREEAIRNIKRFRNGLDSLSESKLIQTLDMAIEALEQTQWTPCSERLPDDSDYYLVTTSWGGVEEVWFAHKKDYDITESEWREIDDEPVAWMPLIQPYREENK